MSNVVPNDIATRAHSVPFNRPFVSDQSRSLMDEALSSHHLSGDGPMSRAAVAALAATTGVERHLLTPSCTHALELALLLAGVGPGDEVILPSFNFPSAATATVMLGATPVFVDVDEETLNLTVEGVLAEVTDRTKAVIVLHYAGILAPAVEIREVADQFGFTMIEDAAHGLGVLTPSGYLGSFGHLACYSFHETKNIHCGEGGSLQINDASLLERAEILREKGTNRQRFFRGQVDKYTWVDKGSSWLLAEPLAALLLGQLRDFENIQLRRRQIFEAYEEGLDEWAHNSGFTLASTRDNQQNAAHMFYVVAPSLSSRQSLMLELSRRGVTAAFHYQPLDSSTAGQRFGRSSGCPVSAALGDRLLRLPVFMGLTAEDQSAVIHAVRSADLS